MESKLCQTRPATETHERIIRFRALADSMSNAPIAGMVIVIAVVL
ncbi:MAG: hypothetical protein PSN37_02115 [Alphaproteobacteria bacterium]|nr:hypothetical protein [Alphaproteobacteria bacterium]